MATTITQHIDFSSKVLRGWSPVDSPVAGGAQYPRSQIFTRGIDCVQDQQTTN